MPSCCGSSGACTCVIVAGGATTVTGVGTVASPYIITLNEFLVGAIVSNNIPLGPSQTPLAGSSFEVSRSDHVHPAAGLFARYGDGSDGDITLDGVNNRSGFTRTGTVYVADRTVMARDLVISTGATLRPAGQIIHVLGTLSGAGTITAATGRAYSTRFASLRPGANAATAVTGVGVQGNNTDDVAGTPGTSGAGGAGTSGAGGAGKVNNSVYVSNGMLAFQLRSPITAFYGILAYSDWNQTTPVTTTTHIAGGCSGGTGAGDGTNVGGASGEGGQVIIVNARRITGTVNIVAPGGAGGAPAAGNAGGGGGGVGGTVVLNTTSTSGWTGALSAPGGAGGAKTGTGVAGSAGAAGLTRLNLWV